MATLQEIANKVVEIGLSGDIDPIRSIKGKYRTIDENNNLINFQTEDLASKLFNISISDPVEVPMSGTLFTNQSTFKINKELVFLTFNNSNISEFLRSIGINVTRVLVEDFKEKLKLAMLNKIATIDLFIPQINPKIFEEYSFDYKTPYSKTEQEIYNFGLSDFYDVNSNYNFYEKQYENSLPSVNEKILPNLYLTQKTSSFATQHSQLEVPGFAGPVALVSDSDFTNGSYFDSWASQVDPYISIYQSVYNKTINQVNYFAINNDFNFLADNDNRRENFPFYNKVNFTTDFGDVGINSLIYDLNINCSFINTCLKEGINTVLTFGNGSLGGQLERSINIVQDSNVSFDNNNIPQITYSYVKNDFIGLELDFMNVLSSSIFDGSRPTVPIANGTTTEQIPVITYLDECSDTNQSIAAKTLNWILSKIEVGQLVNPHFRNYKQIYNGDLTKNETTIYSVRKLLNGAVPVQSLLFMNPLEVKNFLYYDTQIKYNQNYTYEVDAYQVVIGTNYYFDDYVSEENLLILGCYTTPTIKIIQTKYFNKNVIVCDSPPVPLDVQFIPYFGINNKISFYMNNQVARQIADPIKIFNEDQQFIDIARRSQQKLTGPILFETDDTTTFFQILKLETKPSSYSDFKNASITNVALLSGSFSESYLETIQPNKYYYYTFRTVDVHNLISNPTAVYEIKLIDDAGAVYPEINVINEFGEIRKKEPYKMLKKYLHIVPSIQQSYIDTEDESESAKNITNVKLGIADDTIWNKKFKIRLRSKAIGKLVDFNIDFLKNKIN